MLIKDLCQRADFKLLCGRDDKQITSCYIGDLLSLAMSKVTKDCVWVTIQNNINIVAVASLTEAGCIVICEGFSPDENVVKKAQEEDIAILTSDLSAYEIAKILVDLKI